VALIRRLFSAVGPTAHNARTYCLTVSPQNLIPLPLEDEVHLWFMPHEIHAVELLLEGGLDVLPKEERRRFYAFKAPAAARRFFLGRILLRKVLAHYLGVPPDQIELSLDASGKPQLMSPRLKGLNFNLSHDGTEVALAITCGSVVGIDLTALDRSSAVLKISQQYFSSAERREIGALGKGGALAALKLWTLKESIIKAVGNNIWQGLSNVSLSIADGRIQWVIPPPCGKEINWTLNVAYFREHYLLALAQKYAGATQKKSANNLKIYSRVLESDGIKEEEFHPFLMS
jgi:phosphopantetheinyl transferase